MKKLLLAGVAIGALMSGQALAADLRVAPMYKAPPQVAAPVYNWSGFYIGGHVGYGWGRSSSGPITVYDPIDTPVGTYEPGVAYDVEGVLGGAQIGYNLQFNNIVLGIEADISGTDIKGDRFFGPGELDGLGNFTTSTRLEWLSTVRGRVGVAFNNILLYGTGGLAIGSVKSTLDDVYGSGIVTTTDRTTNVGWAAGAGFEVAVSRNWTLKAEYLYVDLGAEDINYFAPDPGWPRVATTGKVTASIGRVGFNYRF